MNWLVQPVVGMSLIKLLEGRHRSRPVHLDIGAATASARDHTQAAKANSPGFPPSVR